MREIEVRDLKAALDQVLGEVESGERVTVTSRGHVVAELVPPGTPRYSPRQRKLIAEGRVTPASQPLPLPQATPRKTSRSASEIVLAEREEEH
jgi:prevent-host-death family protein